MNAARPCTLPSMRSQASFSMPLLRWDLLLKTVLVYIHAQIELFYAAAKRGINSQNALFSAQWHYCLPVP